MNKKKPRIDKVVTKTGDQGFTHIIGDEKISKASLRVDSYGNVDEVNSLIGVIISFMPEENIAEITALNKIQYDLFIAGADLASPSDYHVPRINETHVHHIEEFIEHYQKYLSPLQDFILPGGTKVASLLHLARTVVRRTERSIVYFSESEKINAFLLIYFNRLSDFFFILARYMNKTANISETYCDFTK